MIQLHRRLVSVCVRSQKFLSEVLNRGAGGNFINLSVMGVGGPEEQKRGKTKPEARQIKSHSNHETNHVDCYFFSRSRCQPGQHFFSLLISN